MDDDSDLPLRRRPTRAEARTRTRAALRAAAAQTFARKGFAGASVEEIAEAAGFSIGALYSNFASKEELFLDLAATYSSGLIAEAAGALREHGQGTGALALELGRMLTNAADSGSDFVLLNSEFWLYAMRNPRVLDAMAARMRGPQEALAALVQPDLERRGAPAEASPDSVAAVVAALFDGLARQRLIDPDRIGDDLFGLALKWIFTGIGAAADNPSTTKQDKIP
jgi:AcrR family transcriptional regulator